VGSRRAAFARSWTRCLAAATTIVVLLGTTVPISNVTAALPTGFAESVIWSGLSNPTNIEFAADGRVFIAEKSGAIKVFDSLTDPTPTTFTGLQANAYDYWDRGLLGLALDPSLTNPALPSRPWVYVLYTYDHVLGSSAAPGGSNDACPSPPGPTTDGCVASARLSRFTVAGTTISGPEQVLIEDWCQQFPSHSIGALGFGPDGALYVSAGEAANFFSVDYGQFGGSAASPTVRNPCGDPGHDAMTPPSAEGGALRAQDVRTDGAAIGTPYSQAVMQDQPAGYWRLAETSGTVAADSSGGGHPGTYVGNPTLGVPGLLTGDSDKAARFVASTASHVQIPGGSWLAGSALTLSAWVDVAAVPPDHEGFVGLRSPNDGPNAFYILQLAGGLSLEPRFISSTGAWAELRPTITAGRHFLVLTYDGGYLSLFVDGVLAAQATASGSIGGTVPDLQIGGSGAGNWHSGTVDEVAFYRKALSGARIHAQYAAGTQTGDDPATLDGAILRVDPVTGDAFAGNPFASSSDPNKRRIIAYGLRNPFRFALRPGTSELWLGDVGWNDWEELDRIANIGDAAAEDFGWPCYEGAGRMAGYDAADLTICEDLYAAGPSAMTPPVYTYAHSGPVVPGETCTFGGSSISGITFYPESGGTFPAQYRGALFFADHTRNCIWWMAKGTNGQPDPTTRAVFLAPAANPVDIAVGLDGALYYVDYDGGTIRRIGFSSGNQPPTAIAQANPSSGPAPLTVNFSGTGSTDPEGRTLQFAWDLDGDGAYDDSTSATPTFTYPDPATVTVGLRVTDAGGLTDTDSVAVSIANTPPTPVIDTPVAGTTYAVGQTIAFSGGATDQQDGTIAADRLSWKLTIQHCPSNCHAHDVMTIPGVASGSFAAPDHLYPSYLDLTLTATDSNGVSASTTRRLDPRTFDLTFQTAPAGLQLDVNGVATTAPFTRTVIQGSSNSMIATSPQTIGGVTSTFQSWSDGGAASHSVTATGSATYVATYATTAVTTVLVPTADSEIQSKPAQKNFGNGSTMGVRLNMTRSYVKFSVPAIAGTIQTAKLRVFVRNAGPTAGAVYAVDSTWTETGITWNNAPPITGSPLQTGGAAPIGTWVEFNVTQAVATSTIVSFALSDGSNDAVVYSTRTGTNPPQLVITTTP
jgi:glucose/arabinose dehydrogenase